MASTTATVPADTPAYQLVPLAELRESPINPRKHFDPAKLQELAESIKGPTGIIEPLVVRRRDGCYEIAVGNRRFRAAKLAQLETIPVIIRDLSDAQVLETQVIENDQREDVNPLERAQGYAALMAADPRYQDVRVLAAKIGRHPTYVYRALKLLDLVAPAKKALLEGSLTAAHAEEIARLQPADQKEALGAALDRSDPMTAQELSRWIAQELLLNLSGAPWKKDDATLAAPAGPCTTCPKRTGANPDLFGDIKGKDLCTDRICFQRKREAFFARRVEELSKPDAPVVRLHAGWGYSGNDVKRLKAANILAHEQGWKEAGRETCPHTRTGLVVESERHGDAVGTVKRVCTEPKTCRIHRERFDSTRGIRVDAKQREADRKRQREAQIQTQTRVRALRAIGQRCQVLGKEDLVLVARRVFARFYHPQDRQFVTLMGLCDKKTKLNQAAAEEKLLKAHLTTLGVAKLHAILLQLALFPDAIVNPYACYGSSRNETIEDVARRYKVNVKAIAAAVRKELTPKKKAAPKQAKGRTTTAKAAKKETAA